jgi:hypothetical protein
MLPPFGSLPQHRRGGVLRTTGPLDGMPELAWIDLWTALALVLVIEGVSMSLFPGLLRRALEQLEQMPAEALRWGGLLTALVGVFFLYMLR